MKIQCYKYSLMLILKKNTFVIDCNNQSKQMSMKFSLTTTKKNRKIFKNRSNTTNKNS